MLLACSLASALGAQSEKDQAPVVDSPLDALRQAEFGGRLRYRFDQLDQDTLPEVGRASTLRTSLHMKTPAWNGLRAFVELYTNESIGEDAYFGISNGKSGATYPLIADPEGSGLNRGWLKYENPESAGLRVVLGRQFLHWNDGRMLSNSFYRQNQNTFDALSVALQPRPELELQLAQIWRFDDVFFRDWDMNSQVAQVAWTERDRLRASAYATLFDYDDLDNMDRSTLGLRLSGPYRIDASFALHYTLEYARQQDREENSFEVDADYLVAELGLASRGYLVYLGYNQVSGVTNAATEQPFDQPAGYPYPYRGETEAMVVTPAAGMEILMLRALGPLPGCKGCSFLFHAHQFSQETGSLTYGTDVGLALSYRPEGQPYSAFVKLAHFEQDDAAAGVDSRTRLILGAEVSF